jgi:hypothetical protein
MARAYSNDPKKFNVNIPLTKTVYDRLQKAADRFGLAAATLVRPLIERWLDEVKSTEPRK